MQQDEKERKIDALIERNIPFVIFRAPSEEAKLIIQTSPLDSPKERKINQRGFYVFPFTDRENTSALFFNPDVELPYSELDNWDIPEIHLRCEQKEDRVLDEISQEDYSSQLHEFLSAIEAEGISKAIYSRVKTVHKNNEFRKIQFLESIMERYPKAFVYLIHIPGDGMWIGASPELLLSYKNGSAQTVALAGTLKINTSQHSAPDWTRKEIDEQRLVEKYIIECCKKLNLSFEKTPVRTTSTGKVYHLKSQFTVAVPEDMVLDFLHKLHPTPAISGLPKEKAIDLIYRMEQHNRSYYCGFLGFVNDVSDFDFFINLRCLKIKENKITLFAGGGITKDSIIEKEWEETNLKMATLIDLLPNDVYYKEISPVTR